MSRSSDIPLKPCPFCGNDVIYLRPFFPSGARTRARCTSYIIECGKCWVRLEAELFKDCEDIYKPYGSEPHAATRMYCALKWNSRGEAEFDELVNGCVRSYMEKKKHAEQVEDARTLLRERNL